MVAGDYSHLFKMLQGTLCPKLRTATPVDVDDAVAFRSSSGSPLTASLQALYMVSNGLWIGDRTIVPPVEDLAEYCCEPGLFSIFDWGNGDADCILTDGDGHERVVFCDHGPKAQTILCRGLFAWLGATALEIATRGELWHPMDYSRNVGGAGHPTILGLHHGIRLHDE